MENALVSACLLGIACRYDGRSVEYDGILALREKYNLIPICPEIYGGLPTPRIPSERVGERVISREGKDNTESYLAGAQAALRLAKLFNCKIAILKERSPSCGSREIYDGSFEKRLVSGMGITAELLTKNGIRVVSENEISEL